MENNSQLAIEISQNTAYIEMAIVKKLLIRPFQCNYGNNFIYKKI